ncbi:uncharacterized protein EI90DRAFT_3012946 [Cantharellus anzutake]|uniref:uncharacterized protein n=1 Tax=Cantharellus anzutake TaxID=1750568 RepID=UPI001904E5A4|nr:uncharacterized protein EI90DRAFT_3012946 [Cantharellus anzutake]KAF8338772.1 hypothetical protein EI90DRAFT_3012946 [Cantharellus anzutake]
MSPSGPFFLPGTARVLSILRSGEVVMLARWPTALAVFPFAWLVGHLCYPDWRNIPKMNFLDYLAIAIAFLSGLRVFFLDETLKTKEPNAPSTPYESAAHAATSMKSGQLLLRKHPNSKRLVIITMFVMFSVYLAVPISPTGLIFNFPLENETRSVGWVEEVTNVMSSLLTASILGVPSDGSYAMFEMGGASWDCQRSRTNFTRAFFPVAANSLFALSVKHDILGGYAVYLVISFVTLAAFYSVLQAFYQKRLPPLPPIDRLME